MVIILFFGAGIVMGCLHLFQGSYSSDSDASDIKYSEVEIQAYIPFVRHDRLAYPLICTDVRSFDSVYLSFELPSAESYHQKYPTFQIPSPDDGGMYKIQSLFNRSELPGYSDDDLREIFSEIRHYPPPEDLLELPENPKLWLQKHSSSMKYSKVGYDDPDPEEI